MTRDKFIRKWLANPQKQYNEQCRDEMRDDLDLVIQAAISKSVQKQLITEIMNEDAKDGLYKKQTAVEWLIDELSKFEKGESEYFSTTIIKNKAIRMEKQQIMDAYDKGSLNHHAQYTKEYDNLKQDYIKTFKSE